MKKSSQGTKGLEAALLSEQRYRHLANQELFILRKRPDGFWKVAHFSLSSTNPARVIAFADPFLGKRNVCLRPHRKTKLGWVLVEFSA
jgi:hypothetical protein